MRWQWNQLDHVQIICTLLQTDNHASTSPLSFIQAECPSCRPTNSNQQCQSTEGCQCAWNTQHNNDCFMALCQGLPGWAGTRRNTHPPYWSSSNLYQFLPSITIHRILLVQITCLVIFLHNFCPRPFWSTSLSGVLHLIFRTFLHSISVLVSQHIAILSQPVLL